MSLPAADEAVSPPARPRRLQEGNGFLATRG